MLRERKRKPQLLPDSALPRSYRDMATISQKRAGKPAQRLANRNKRKTIYRVARPFFVSNSFGREQHLCSQGPIFLFSTETPIGLNEMIWAGVINGRSRARLAKGRLFKNTNRATALILQSDYLPFFFFE